MPGTLRRLRRRSQLAPVQRQARALLLRVGRASLVSVAFGGGTDVGCALQTLRWYKNVGLGFKTPKEAIVGNYVDKKCPFTGNVSIRGRILKGMVISAGTTKL